MAALCSFDLASTTRKHSTSTRSRKRCRRNTGAASKSSRDRDMATLSRDLQQIFDLELAEGNEVARIDEPAGTTCPYAIIFKNPLHIREIAKEIVLTNPV